MKRYLLSLLLLPGSFSLFAIQQKALIIGIDNYAPPAKYANTSKNRTNWPSLDGCKNDALAMKDAVIARYGFRQADIHELYNADATRKNILDGMNNLLAQCNSGDVAFIFYAGHGSQVKNSLSKEPGQMDQSMVPVNTWEPGVPDIRDKELGKIFNEFVDKGVILTVIYDCCHASNMSRGITDMPKMRYIESPDYDAKDPSSPDNPAEKAGSKFLMFAACQSYQFASEARDDHNQPHGAFTLAILEAMKQLSVNASVTDIFNDARAILKCNGKTQEPSLTGSPDRLNGTLFGLSKGALSDKVLVPVMGIDDDGVLLQGGIISGLDTGAQLKNTDGSVTLRVTEMNGADRCVATVTSGDIKKIKGGDLYEVTNWVSGKKAFLKIYIPNVSTSYENVRSLAAECEKLKKNSSVKWVYDIEMQDPTVSIFTKDGSWYANTSKGQVKVNSFTADAIASQFRGETIFINLPPTGELIDSIKSNMRQQANVRLTTDPSDANYALIGRMANDTLEYALSHVGFSTKDSLETMPSCTFYEKLTKSSSSDVAAKLTEYALKLGKMRVWFTLSNPAGDEGFPYTLEMRDHNNKKIDSTVPVGERITLHIVKDKTNQSNEWDNSFRYVYVFIIDHSGAMQLIYPPLENGNDQNHFPDKSNPKNDDYTIPGKFTIRKPTGTDNYYMLTTTEPILAYATVFKQSGVSRGESRGIGGKLDDLFNLGNVSSRGVGAETPNDWAIKKLSIKTVYKMTP